MAPQAVLSLALSNPSTEDTEIFRNKHSKALRWKAQPSGLIYVGVLAKEIAFPSKETVAGSYPRAFRPTQTRTVLGLSLRPPTGELARSQS